MISKNIQPAPLLVMTRGLVQGLSTCCGPEKKNDTCASSMEGCLIKN